MDVNMTACYSL